MFTNFLQNRKPRSNTGRDRRARLAVELLETRTVPASLNLLTGQVLVDHSTDWMNWSVSVQGDPLLGAISVRESAVEPSGVRHELSSSFPPLLTHSIRILGGTGNENVFLHDLPSWMPATVDGGSGTNSLTMEGGDTFWDINSDGGGTVNNVVQFTHIRSVNGDSGNDHFTVSNNGRVDGISGGGSGFDTLDYSGRTQRVVLDMDTISFIDYVRGSTANDDELIARGTVHITDYNAGDVGGTAFGTTFSGFENLTAAANRQTRFVFSHFVLGDGTSIWGEISGAISSQVG